MYVLYIVGGGGGVINRCEVIYMYVLYLVGEFNRYEVI